MPAVRRHPLVSFFVLTYVVAWAFVPFGSFGAFAPLVAALVVAPLAHGREGLVELGRRVVRGASAGTGTRSPSPCPWACTWVAALLDGGGLVLASGSIGAALLAFLIRLVNPTDGPLGEEPGWRGFALPGMQARLSPLAATAILAVVITVWHLPLAFLASGDPWANVAIIVVGTVAVTFWYTWLFDHTGGSVLLVVVAHAVEGAIRGSGLLYMTVWLAVAVLLVVIDLRSWLRTAPPAARTTLPAAPTAAGPRDERVHRRPRPRPSRRPARGRRGRAGGPHRPGPPPGRSGWAGCCSARRCCARGSTRGRPASRSSSAGCRGSRRALRPAGLRSG